MPNSIQVDYTPQTTGVHRICYRQTSPVLDPVFCCMLDVSITPAMVGTLQSYTITEAGVTPCDSGGPVSPVGVAPDTYTYDGYVQPVCDPEESVTFRTNWAAPVDFVVV